MKIQILVSAAAAALLLAAGPALSFTDGAVPGQKLDSALGDLPHYREWADPSGRQPMGSRVLGESLDDGLGELPHYSTWTDPSGRDPLGRAATLVATRQR